MNALSIAICAYVEYEVDINYPGIRFIVIPIKSLLVISKYLLLGCEFHVIWTVCLISHALTL